MSRAIELAKNLEMVNADLSCMMQLETAGELRRLDAENAALRATIEQSQKQEPVQYQMFDLRFGWSQVTKEVYENCADRTIVRKVYSAPVIGK